MARKVDIQSLSSLVGVGMSWNLWSDVTCCAPLQEHWATFPNPSVWKGECLHIELRYRSSQISRGLLGSARAGGMCVVEVEPWRLLPSTTRLSFLSVPGVLSRYLPTRRAVEIWIGGSVGVASVPLSRRPSKIPADSGSMDSLRRTPSM